jgi:hypothetical protein
MLGHRDARGVRLESALTRIEHRTGERPLVAVMLGIILALGVVAGGLVLFLATWAFLVGVLH